MKTLYMKLKLTTSIRGPFQMIENHQRAYLHNRCMILTHISYMPTVNNIRRKKEKKKAKQHTKPPIKGIEQK
jgi:hypothetical protein